MTLVAKNALFGKKIVLGITGGIAAYKIAELCRLLVKAKVDLQVVMTEAATQFITPTTLQALSGKPVMLNQWEPHVGNGMPHIEHSRGADLIVIAPASADFIAKLAHGFANDLLSTLCLARECALMVAPAMNKQMWENAATKRNVQQLLNDGIGMLGPASGEQACGEIGLGRMLEPAELLDGIQAYLTPKLFNNKNILITAGATIEMLDPVRGITNLSSGKMGYAIAKAAKQMGANVTLISGASALTPPEDVTFISALSASLMYEKVMQTIDGQDIFISVAAVADYSPEQISTQKIKKNEPNLSLSLKKNKDILAEVASLAKPPFCVGFAAETENVIAYAKQKRIAKRLPLIVANEVSSAMGSDYNQVTLIDNHGEHPLPPEEKAVIATQILSHIAHLI